MKKIFNIPFFTALAATLSVLISMDLLAQHAVSAQSTVYMNSGVSTIVSAWQTQDDSGNTGIQGAVGDFSDPNSLLLTTLTIPNSSQNSQPILISNGSGDCCAIWQYVDTNNVFQIGASVLPSGSIIWTTPTTISPSSGYTAGLFDQAGFIDSNGNILITWTALNTVTQNYHVLGATYQINVANPAWSLAVNVSQN